MRIVFETLWTRLDDGWSISSRAYARAIAMAGHDVRLLANTVEPSAELHPDVLAEIPRGMRRPTRNWDLYAFSTPLGGWQVMRRAGTFAVLDRYRPPRLFYTMFERLRLQPELAGALRQTAEGVWVPCSQNLQVLRAAGVKNATWVPFPHFPDDPYLALPPPRREPTTFLWVGRWERRKAPHNVLRAFFRAFAPGEAKLILKTNGSHGPDPAYLNVRDTIATNLGGRWTRAAFEQDVRVVDDFLTRRQMAALMAEADVYVSASRGEGLDLPSYAAKLAGRTLVTTDSGGPRDFVGEGDHLVPAKGEFPLPEYAWLWDPGATVIDYDLGDLVTAMQRARSRRPQRSDMSKFEARSVARVLREWLGQWEK